MEIDNGCPDTGNMNTYRERGSEKNMFIKFYEAMAQVDWKNNTHIIIALLVIFVIVAYMLNVIATYKLFSLRNVISAILFAPYMTFSFLWMLCFSDDTFITQLVPVCPLLVILGIKKLGYIMQQQDKNKA